METIKLQASFLLMIFHNEHNGYSVARFVSYDKQEKEFTATGIMGELQEDQVYDLYGHYEEHPRYGMQFQLERYEKTKPNDVNSLVRYFSGPSFPGIGKKLAEQIVTTLGEDAITRILEDADVLLPIRGLSEKKRLIIVQGVSELADLDDSVVFFMRYGFSPQLIAKLQAIYGEQAVALIKENPYRMVAEVDGVGFVSADKMARSLAFAQDHPYRIKAAVLSAVLSVCMSSGDTYTDRESVLREVRRTLGMEPSDLEAILEELSHERNLRLEEDRIYHHSQYDAERGIAAFLARFPYQKLNEPTQALDEEIAQLETSDHIVYEDKQKLAIEIFFKESFALISGGPGTGKTTIVKGIVQLAQKLYPQAVIALCAPTGRAAKRLSQLSDGSATTIHALLKWDLESNHFTKDERDPLDVDILIVDEFSMVDAWVFYSLLKASANVSKILLIGDKDQLPSVAPGCVLQDLIESACFPTIFLEKIFRQSEGSDVVALAHEIKEGSVTTLKQAKDVAFFACAAHEVCARTVQIVESAYEKGYDNRDIQVLAPMYNGVAGIDALNHALQAVMNPPATHKRELRIGYRLFREGDKILQLKNQPDDDVYNGDIGVIEEIIYANEDIHKQNRIIANFDDVIVEYSKDAIYHITHAYCTSIHKAQGSEYAIVIMPLVLQYRHMLERRLFYTGVSRAKRSLVLLGEQDALYQAVHATSYHMRKSTLKTRIQAVFANKQDA